MGEGNGTLLGGNWEEVNAKLDQLPAHLFVKTEIVMARQVVPIFWAMVHEIDTESRTLPAATTSTPRVRRIFSKPSCIFCPNDSTCRYTSPSFINRRYMVAFAAAVGTGCAL